MSLTLFWLLRAATVFSLFGLITYLLSKSHAVPTWIAQAYETGAAWFPAAMNLAEGLEGRSWVVVLVISLTFLLIERAVITKEQAERNANDAVMELLRTTFTGATGDSLSALAAHVQALYDGNSKLQTEAVTLLSTINNRLLAIDEQVSPMHSVLAQAETAKALAEKATETLDGLKPEEAALRTALADLSRQADSLNGRTAELGLRIADITAISAEITALQELIGDTDGTELIGLIGAIKNDAEHLSTTVTTLLDSPLGDDSLGLAFVLETAQHKLGTLRLRELTDEIGKLTDLEQAAENNRADLPDVDLFLARLTKVTAAVETLAAVDERIWHPGGEGDELGEVVSTLRRKLDDLHYAGDVVAQVNTLAEITAEIEDLKTDLITAINGLTDV